MTEHTGNYNTIAPLKNVAAMTMLIKRVQNRDHGIPGMGVFFGPAGFGKSYAALYAANTLQACVVQCKSVWTRKALCLAILNELGITPGNTISGMVDQISEYLAQTGVPLLIDEADFLVQKNMVEIVRDIYESSFSPVILIGEELMPQKLRKWERVHSRILSWVPARPADEDDLKVLKANLCRNIEIDPDIMRAISKSSRGSVRRLVSNLSKVKEFAETRDKDVVTNSDWGSRGFDAGETPMPRRGFAA